MTDVLVECADVHSESCCSLGVDGRDEFTTKSVPSQTSMIVFFYFYPLTIFAKISLTDL